MFLIIVGNIPHKNPIQAVQAPRLGRAGSCKRKVGGSSAPVRCIRGLAIFTMYTFFIYALFIDPCICIYLYIYILGSSNAFLVTTGKS